LITLTGVADSASTAEYCGASVGVKKTEGARESARFLGIAVHKVLQYIDAISAKQVAENPKKLGSARHLGIRWHLVRCHLHAKDLELSYSTTEDFLTDHGTKRLARKTLARFAIIFFNCLSKTWQKGPNSLGHIYGAGIFAELDYGCALYLQETSTSVTQMGFGPPGYFTHISITTPIVSALKNYYR
jgi:hypothetical protein